jgi:hypothetical protein
VIAVTSTSISIILDLRLYGRLLCIIRWEKDPSGVYIILVLLMSDGDVIVRYPHGLGLEESDIIRCMCVCVVGTDVMVKRHCRYRSRPGANESNG